MLSLDCCFIFTLFVKHVAPKDTIKSLSATAVDGVDVGEEHYVHFAQPSWLFDASVGSSKVPKSHPRSEIVKGWWLAFCVEMLMPKQQFETFGDLKVCEGDIRRHLEGEVTFVGNIHM